MAKDPDEGTDLDPTNNSPATTVNVNANEDEGEGALANIPGCSRSLLLTTQNQSNQSVTVLELEGCTSRNNNNSGSIQYNDNFAPETPIEVEPAQEEPLASEEDWTPLPPLGTKRSAWIPKQPGAKNEQDEFDDQSSELKQNYKEAGSHDREGAGSDASVIIISGSEGEDNPELCKQKEPLDKPGKAGDRDAGRRREQPPIHFIVRFINCSRNMFDVDANLLIPKLRMKFLAKVMAVKSVQWIFLIGCFVAMKMNPETEAFFIKTPEIGYLIMMVYITAVAAARVCDYGRRTWGALLTIYIETLCIWYVIGQILFSSDASEDYILPLTVATITLTNVSIAILSALSKADMSENSPIYGLAAGIVFILSIIGLVVSTTLNSPVKNSSTWFKRLCAMSFFNFIISITYVMMELSDIHFILRGYRFPVSESDWLVVAGSLF